MRGRIIVPHLNSCPHLAYHRLGVGKVWHPRCYTGSISSSAILICIDVALIISSTRFVQQVGTPIPFSRINILPLLVLKQHPPYSHIAYRCMVTAKICVDHRQLLLRPCDRRDRHCRLIFPPGSRAPVRIPWLAVETMSET